MADQEATGQPMQRTMFEDRMSLFWTIQAYGVVAFAFICFFPSLSHVGEYLLFTLLATAVAGVWLERRTLVVHTPIDLPLLLFVGWVLVSLPFATDPAYSFGEWRKLVAKVLAFYWVAGVMQIRPKCIETGVVRAVLLGATVLCLYALAEFGLRGGGLADRFVRAGAPSSDYNWLSTYMVMVIPLIALTGMVAEEWWKRMACAGLLGLALLTLTFSYTRAGWLGLVAEGLFLGWLTRSRRFTVSFVVACVLIGLGLFLVSKAGYQRSTVDPWTLDARVGVWELGLEEMTRHPIVGVGYGNNTFWMRFAGHPRTEKIPALHNTFLMVGMGSGLPALLLLVWIFIRGIRSLVASARRIADPPRSYLMLAIAVMMIGFATRNFFDYMFAGSLAFLFWTLVAVGLMAGQRDVDTNQDGSSAIRA